MAKTNTNKIIFFSFCLIILFSVVKGIPENPTSEELNTFKWKENGPFELSPERGRFALIYSIAEDKSLQYSKKLALFPMPDLAVSEKGDYVSMFTPGVSILALPGYILGKYFGAAQLGAFSAIALFAVFNIILIIKICGELGIHPLAAKLGALSFAFATPAFSYATTLYQHHISVFIILLSILLLLKWKNWLSLALVWFLLAFSIVVDNPNIFLIIPVIFYAFSRIISAIKRENGLEINLKPIKTLTLGAMIIPFGFLLWFNMASHGNPFQLSGTLPNAEIIESHSALEEKTIIKSIHEIETGEGSQDEKNVLGFFNTRNLFNGFYIHIFSPDRGVVWYAPVIFLGIYGLILLYRKKRNIAAVNVIVATIGINIIVYSLWGDPYGGWAFGSRYLILSYSLLVIGVAAALSAMQRNYYFLFIFFILFFYSAGVNALGAVTTNANPPKIEVLALEEKSGREEKYTYERNWDYLNNTGSKSFFFQSYAKNFVSARQYYEIIVSFISLAAAFLTLSLFLSNRRKQ